MSKEGSKLIINWRGIAITIVVMTFIASLYSLWLYMSILDAGQRLDAIENRDFSSQLVLGTIGICQGE